MASLAVRLGRWLQLAATEISDRLFAINTIVVGEDGQITDAQHPFPTNGDSVYCKDIWAEESEMNTFSGSVCDLFDALHSIVIDTSSNNPKEILIHLHRTTPTTVIGIGAFSGNFSNLKIIALTSGSLALTLVDESTNNTKYTSRQFDVPAVGFNAIKLQFHTSDSISLSNLFIAKSQSVVSRIQAQKPDDVFTELQATQDGNLKVTEAENGLAIAKGLVVGSTFVHKFGKAPDFDISDGYVSVWDGADDGALNQMQYVYSTSAIIDSISSSNAGDLHPIKIQGLDENWEVVTQTKTLNGQNRIALDTPMIRVFRMKNDGVTDLSGNVFCYENTALSAGAPIDTTKVRAVINNGNNQTLMAIYTIPAGKTGYARDWYVSAAGARKTSVHNVRLWGREFGHVFQLKHDVSIAIAGTSYLQHKYEEPEMLGEKTDMEMRCNTDEDAAGISAGFDIVLVDN